MAKRIKRLTREKTMQAKKKGFVPFAKKGKEKEIGKVNSAKEERTESPKMASMEMMKAKFAKGLGAQRFSKA